MREVGQPSVVMTASSTSTWCVQKNFTVAALELRTHNSALVCPPVRSALTIHRAALKPSFNLPHDICGADLPSTGSPTAASESTGLELSSEGDDAAAPRRSSQPRKIAVRGQADLAVNVSEDPANEWGLGRVSDRVAKSDDLSVNLCGVSAVYQRVTRPKAVANSTRTPKMMSLRPTSIWGSWCK